MEGAPPDLWIPPSCCPVDLCRGFVFEGLVGALLIVVAEEAVEAGEQLLWILVAAQVDVLVLDGAPEPFDEDVVHPAPPPIHADQELRVAQGAQEGGAGEPELTRRNRAQYGIQVSFRTPRARASLPLIPE